MTTAVARFSRTLKADQDAPGGARRAIAQRLQWLGTAVDTELVMLLTSEVVTNAVVHAPHVRGGSVDVSGEWLDSRFRVSVTNSGPMFGWRPVRLPTVGMRGRGLALVDRAARDWGITHDDGTTCVWFEVDCVPA